MSNQNHIAACLVVHNEEAVIERCLASLKDVVDEIIVVHDGACTDKTLKISRRYTSKIFTRPFLGIAEGHRIFSFEQTQAEWVLWIDADEFLSDQLRHHMREMVSQDTVDAFEVIWPLWDGGRYITNTWPYRPVLFRRSTMRYLDFPQEPLRTLGVIRRVPYRMEHQPPYNNFTWKRFRTKWLRWAHIQATMTMKPFAEIPKFQIEDTDWSPKFRFARRYSWLFPFIGIYCMLASVRGGAWKQGWAGWRQSMMWGAYNAAVYYYVSLAKLSPKP